MTNGAHAAAAVVFALALASTGTRTASPRPITIDDEMKLRAIVDVRISPDGHTVAYVVSTPSLPKNEHEGSLYVVKADGGSPTRIGDAVRIFNAPVPRPQLRWSPDGAVISVVGFGEGRPQV